MDKAQILHITPHMGGGVGKAISGIIEWERAHNSIYSYKILMLEAPENSQFLSGIEYSVLSDGSKLEKELETADIVIIHWWHHPLTAQLLANFPQIKTRIIIWSHINGCTYPILPFKLVDSAHKAFFTSKYTLDNPCWNEEEQDRAREKASIVYGLGKLDKVDKYPPPENQDFTVGYIGTINFNKLHPDFVEYCYEALKLLPSVKFVLVGNPEEKESILEQAKAFGIADKFEFVGYSTDVYEQLARFNAFGYLLNPVHFGTTENVILEAINASVPVVVLNQCSEKYLIEHEVTGFLAENKHHYAQIIKNIHDNKDLVPKITQNALTYLSEEFSMEKNISTMRRGIEDVLNMDKKIFEFRSIFGAEPHEWFLSCLATKDIDKNEQIKKYNLILKGKSKSSINHFLRYFKDDINLQNWADIIQGAKITDE